MGQYSVLCVCPMELECITSTESVPVHPQNHEFLLKVFKHLVMICPYKNDPCLCLEKVKCAYLKFNTSYTQASLDPDHIDNVSIFNHISQNI